MPVARSRTWLEFNSVVFSARIPRSGQGARFALVPPVPTKPDPALPGPMLDEAVADDPAPAPVTAPPRNGSPPAAAVARRGTLPGADPWPPQPTTHATAATTITITRVHRTGASSAMRTRSPLVTRYRARRLRGTGAPSPREGVAWAPVPVVTGLVGPAAPFAILSAGVHALR